MMHPKLARLGGALLARFLRGSGGVRGEAPTRVATGGGQTPGGVCVTALLLISLALFAASSLPILRNRFPVGNALDGPSFVVLSNPNSPKIGIVGTRLMKPRKIAHFYQHGKLRGPA